MDNGAHHSERRRRAFGRPRVLAGFIAFLIATQPLAAATLNWIDPAGGGASTASNWNPAQAPTSADDVVFNLGNITYGVFWSSTVPSSNRHTYRTSTVNMTVTSPHTIQTALVVGSASGDNASLVLGTGDLSSVGSVSIGSSGGSTGNLSVTDDDASVSVTGATNDLFVGLSGVGSLNVTGGGTVTAQDDIIVGSNVGGNGTVAVTGRDAVSLVPSGLYTNAGDLILGQSTATATATVSNGATGALSQDLILAPDSGATGTFTISNGGGNPAEFYVQRDLNIARNATSLAAGSGSVNVNAGGSLFVTGATRLGDANGNGAASIHIEGDGLLETGSLVALNGLDLDGGTLRINGGAFDPQGTTFTLLGAGNPVVELNGASLSLSATTSNALTVGNGGTSPGTLRLVNGGTVGIGGGSADALIRGGTPASVLEVISNSIFNGDRNFNNQGTATVGTGSRIESQNLNLSGTTTVSGTGSQLQAAGVLTNSGTLTLGAGAAATAASGANSSSMSVASGASLTVTNTFANSGSISITGGQITAGTLDFDGTGSLTGRGTALARVLMDSSTAFITASGGALTLGNAADAAGFFSSGTLNVSNQTVTLQDADAATFGNVTVNTGTLNAPNGGTLAAGSSISGNGLINPSFVNFGSILPSAAAGLRFAGTVTGVGQGITGTKVTFLGGSQLIGAGTVAASVDVDAGAAVQASGPLTLGRATDTAGWVSDGLLAVGAEKVSLLDADAAQLGNVTMAQGQLTLPPAGANLLAGRSVTGEGEILNDLFNSGSVLPSGHGLVFTGVLNGTGQGVTGTRLNFASRGGFTGAGLLDALIDADDGSTITAAGNLTLGRSTSAAGVVLDGVLNTGSGLVTLLDLNGVGLGSATSVQGGTLRHASTLSLPATRFLNGNGTVDTPQFVGAGTIRPSLVAGGVIGSLQFTGQYIQQAGSRLELDIRGTTAGANKDHVGAGSTAQLAGHIAVAVGGGFAPAAGTEIPLVTAPSVSGVFDTFSVTGLPANTAGAIGYYPDRVVLRVLADADGDGSADLFDCDPGDGTVFAVPSSVSGLDFLADTTTLVWISAAPSGGSSTVHNVKRGRIGEFPVELSTPPVCVVTAEPGTMATDADVPAPGTGFYYLIGAGNSCGVGFYGFDGDGSPYMLGSCP